MSISPLLKPGLSIDPGRSRALPWSFRHGNVLLNCGPRRGCLEAQLKNHPDSNYANWANQQIWERFALSVGLSAERPVFQAA